VFAARTTEAQVTLFLFLACIGDSRLCLAEQDPRSLSAVYYDITSFMLYELAFTLLLTFPPS
jgi:hypothetical protein